MNKFQKLKKIFNKYSKQETEGINFVPSSLNTIDNYNNYVESVLKSLKNFPKIKFEEKIRNLSKSIIKKNPSIKNLIYSKKKLLILDLDETLVHADFENLSQNYDLEIQFKDKNEIFSVGVFLRPYLNEFLDSTSKIFDIGIYTGSVKAYADAILDRIDPTKIYFKFVLYREDCININDKICIKDLNIFGIPLNKIVIIDNSLYSFSNQLSNGILITSFYQNKNDTQLKDVLSYLINIICKSEDVRLDNEEVFQLQTFYHSCLN